ncbi:hypothetical protein J2790_002928 [Paenarthrobacter nicotinovorans]|nr:hypothetical protein [Paenarthrobacter nicotinovorans]
MTSVCRSSKGLGGIASSTFNRVARTIVPESADP